ncbi:MAG: hypothetical protein LBC56_02440 [Oscillospiraceae bacterium]|jgi:hypothetical protein|nr:hypothetical protein [Oscillospiraceae bacterium]
MSLKKTISLVLALSMLFSLTGIMSVAVMAYDGLSQTVVVRPEGQSEPEEPETPSTGGGTVIINNYYAPVTYITIDPVAAFLATRYVAFDTVFAANVKALDVLLAGGGLNSLYYNFTTNTFRSNGAGDEAGVVTIVVPAGVNGMKHGFLLQVVKYAPVLKVVSGDKTYVVYSEYVTYLNRQYGTLFNINIPVTAGLSAKYVGK